MRFLNVGFLAGMLFVANIANCQPNLVLLVSQSGDYIGGGQTHITTNPADFSVNSDIWGLGLMPSVFISGLTDPETQL